MEWVKKRKGCADIYTHPELENAIVDRRGFGISSAVGHVITYRGVAFKSVEEAKKIAEEEILPEKFWTEAKLVRAVDG